jgi:hypothetical protein
MFLTLMVIGIAGLATMALPAFVRGGAGALPRGPSLPVHGPAHVHVPLPALPRAPDGQALPAIIAAHSGVARWLPSPRGVLTVLALFGAFGNVFADAFRFSPLSAALAALVPTFLVERLAVRPLWNLVFRFQAEPTAPLEHLILSEATAVVPFRNGRGMVSVHREGRIVQFRASLSPGHAGRPVNVGDRLRIEDVDARNERVTVSVPDGE